MQTMIANGAVVRSSWKYGTWNPIVQSSSTLAHKAPMTLARPSAGRYAIQFHGGRRPPYQPLVNRINQFRMLPMHNEKRIVAAKGNLELKIQSTPYTTTPINRSNCWSRHKLRSRGLLSMLLRVGAR